MEAFSISTPTTDEDELENFIDALYSSELGIEHYETKIGTRKTLVDTKPSWARDKNGEPFSWIEYNFIEKGDELYGENGHSEIYVPGFIRDGYFLPAVSRRKKREITNIVSNETGLTPRFRPKDRFYPDGKPEMTVEDMAVNIAVVENDIDIEPLFNEDTGVEVHKEIGAEQIAGTVYGYIDKHTKNTDMDLDAIDREIEVVGEVKPYGEIEPVPHRARGTVRTRLYNKNTDLDDIYFMEELDS